MPSLKLCHRRWSLGSDDLLIPAVVLILLHSACLLCFFVVIGLHLSTSKRLEYCQQTSTPKPSAGPPVFVHPDAEPSDSIEDNTTPFSCHPFVYVALLSLCGISLFGSILLEAAVAYYSSQGTIMNPVLRQPLVPFLGTRYAFLFIETGMVIYTYIWWYSCSCPSYSLTSTLLLVVAATENAVVILLPLIAICSFDFSGARWYRLQKAVGAVSTTPSSSAVAGDRGRVMISHTKRRMIVAREAKDAYARSWFKQFNLWFCCLGAERHAQQGTFAEVGKLFSEIFGDTDLVASDLIAGLLLLRRVQKRVIRQTTTKSIRTLSGVPVEFDVDGEDSKPPTANAMLKPDESAADKQLLLRFLRVFRFAHSATGWVFYSIRHPCFLAAGPLCCCDPVGREAHLNADIQHDNTCRLNMRAVLRQSRLPEADLVFADFESTIGETAFFVAIDARQQTVVVSVRGTLSLSDVLTDLNADSARIDLQSESFLAHKGMLAAAVALRDRLIGERILEKAFAQAEEQYGLRFRLELVGHSLGAGVATLLGILLKPDFIDLHVFAFSPPGGLLSLAAAVRSESFVTSVILGKDIVPRIGIRQIEALRADIVNVLKACRQPKWSVIGQAALCCCNNAATRDESWLDFATIKTMRNSVSLHADEASLEEQPDVDEPLARNTATNAGSNLEGIKVRHDALRLPGSIYHIVRTWCPPVSNSDVGRVEFRVLRTHRDFYDHVLVSPRMLGDHMPNTFLDALEELHRQYGLDMADLVPLADR